MFDLIKEIFSKKTYIISFAITSIACWILVGIYQNGETFLALWGIIPFWSWIIFVSSFSKLIFFNNHLFNFIFLILNILNISLYISLKIYAYKNRVKTKKTLGVLGSILVFFGIGCASCGSLALISILSFVGVGGALAILPYGGAEITYIAFVILLTSNLFLLKQLAKKVCPV